MLARFVEVDTAEPVRRHITLLTSARVVGNAGFRFAPPFLATIASGLGTSLATLGVALTISELAGFCSPLIGQALERTTRRAAMTCAMAASAGGAALTALAPNVTTFALGLLVIATAKICFDLAFGAWIADHVELPRRGRIVGISETSWSFGLLLGVSALALVVAISSWRWAYGVAAVAALAMTSLVRARLDHDAGPDARAAADRTGRHHDRRGDHDDHDHDDRDHDRGVDDDDGDDGDPQRLGGHGHGGDDHSRDHGLRPATAPPRRDRIGLAGWAVLAAGFGLMGGAQFAIVTFGSWLDDEHGVGAGGLAAVVFGLGIVELVAAIAAARGTDTWGKERSVTAGALLMVPCAIGLAATSAHLGLGLVLLGLFLLGFEFGLVSILPLGTSLTPSQPARALGMLFGAGTIGRAAAAIPATAWYEDGGMTRPMLAGAALSVLTVLAIGVRRLALAAAPTVHAA